MANVKTTRKRRRTTGGKASVGNILKETGKMLKSNWIVIALAIGAAAVAAGFSEKRGTKLAVAAAVTIAARFLFKKKLSNKQAAAAIALAAAMAEVWTQIEPHLMTLPLIPKVIEQAKALGARTKVSGGGNAGGGTGGYIRTPDTGSTASITRRRGLAA